MARYIDEKDVYALVEPRGVAKVHCSQIDELPRADVAREIFEEIENAHEECIHIDPSTNIGYLLQSKFEHKLAELKKKYTEGEGCS